MRILRYLLAVFIILGCTESNQWGLMQVQIEHSLELKKKTEKNDINFSVTSSSDVFQTRLYFKGLEIEQTPIGLRNASEKIYQLLDGFSYAIINDEKKDTVSSFKVNSIRDISINIEEPHFIWLGSNIELDRKNNYVLNFEMPSVIVDDSSLSNPVFVLGVQPQPSL